MRITSPHNERLKAAVKLRDRKGRDEQGRMIIDGLREIGRALEAGLQVVELYYDESLAGSNEGAKLLTQVERQQGALLECTPAVFAKIAYGERHSGAVAVASAPRCSLDRFAERQWPSAPLFCVLEGVEKPGNVGAVLRSADAAGVQGLIVADGGTDLFNPNAIRASAGAIFSVPLAAARGSQARDWLRARQFQLVAARVDAQDDYTAVDFARPTAIILGSEAHGLTAAWQADDIRPIRLPMCGQVDSLNVSITAAVLFYEALRQRQRG
jgi:TrmH family RNA methyltransferase